jgi:hypothetical protein
VHKPIAVAFLFMYFLSGAAALVGPFYVYNAFGGFPDWGMVTGDR